MWNHESEDVKDHYKVLAQQAHETHQRTYPDYKYKPRRPGERKRRGVHHEIIFGHVETAADTDESFSFDMKGSPVDYDMNPAPGSDCLGFESARFCSDAV